MKTAPKIVALLSTLGFAALSGCASPGPLVSAAGEGNIAQVTKLIDQGADINMHDAGVSWCDTPLEFAAKHSQDKVVEYLLNHGAVVRQPPFVKGGPLTCAIVVSSYWTRPRTAKIIRLLLDAGAKTDPTLMRLLPYFHKDVGDDVVALIERANEAQTNPAPVSAVAPGATAAAPTPATAPISDVDRAAEHAAERPDDFALVIGIEDYESVPKADYGVRDARAVRRHLEALGWPARNIVSLEGQAATGNKLKSYLQEWLPLNVKPDTTLFVYYSGHGAPDPKSGDAYLVPWDGDPKFLKSTAYPLKQLYAELAALKVKRVIVALDACFSGAGGRSVLAKGARPLVVQVADGVPASENLTVLAAASGDEITGTLDEQGHGMFTYYLLKGLSGAAKDASGAVTPKGLYDYVKPRVEDESRRQNRAQTPTFNGSASDAPLARY